MLCEYNKEQITYRMDHLLETRSRSMQELDKIQRKLCDVDVKIRHFLQKYGVQCSSCGRHFLTKDVWIATQRDVDEYTDMNDGYAGPTVGEYYCGC
jgi:glycyl-tRNA synthetase (class II)